MAFFHANLARQSIRDMGVSLQVISRLSSSRSSISTLESDALYRQVGPPLIILLTVPKSRADMLPNRYVANLVALESLHCGTQGRSRYKCRFNLMRVRAVVVATPRYGSRTRPLCPLKVPRPNHVFTMHSLNWTD